MNVDSRGSENGNDTIGKINDDNKAIMIFQASTTRLAASPENRLPANYVGVRQVRPSNLLGKRDGRKGSNHKNDSSNGNSSNGKTPIKFVVIDEHGNERRMTKAEKKAKKQEIALQKKQAKHQAREDAENSAAENKETNATTDSNRTSNANVAIEAAVGTCAAIKTNTQDPPSSYHQMPLNESVMEQELEEIREENTKLAPVVLSPPMAMQFRDKLQSSSTENSSDANTTIIYNHAKSQEWANLLKERRILPAEEYRSKEDLRPLAYKLNPEPWQRLRPSLEEKALSTKRRRREAPNEGSPRRCDNEKSAEGQEMIPIEVPKSCDWASMTCRPPCPPSQSSPLSHDDMLSIVFEYIHRETQYYVSCGAKFGSDFLIYDGPREERHAFAGLRVLSPQFSPKTDENGVLPLPTAYSLTSYVRCLNTAGKLALLATIVLEQDQYQVLFIDVALEKVLDAPTHNRKRIGSSNQEKRKDITKNLAKT